MMMKQRRGLGARFGASMAVVLALAAGLSAQTVQPQPKMGEPVDGLSPLEKSRFDAGRVQFTRVFQVADGLGPIMNQSACASCHNNPVGGSGSIFVTRFGFYDGENDIFDPLDALGGSLLQAQTINAACAEVIPPLANVTAQRMTNSTLGMGLVESIVDADILNNTVSPAPGVTGAAHIVTPFETPMTPRVGRFGWKAQVATILTFSADAAQNEMGITNRFLPTENAPNGNLAALAACDTIADPEDQPDTEGLEFIDRLTDFQRFLAAPPQTPKSGMTGETIFNAIGCAACHRASYQTSTDPSIPAALRNKTIRPYSDFLLHDMGSNADFIAQGAAGIQELRTPSLWGIRVRDPMWHDGRVAGGNFSSRITSAIALHDGIGSEGSSSAQAYAALSGADKQRVIDFLNSLGRAEFDVDGNNQINYTDLNAFLAVQGAIGVTPDSPNAIFDIDQNGMIDSADFDSLALAFDVDCNGNGTSDLVDFQNGTSYDSNNNWIPDECETCQLDVGFGGSGTFEISICGDSLATSTSRATMRVDGAEPFTQIYGLVSFTGLPRPLGTEIIVPTFPFVFVEQSIVTDANGRYAGTIFGSPIQIAFVLQCAQILPNFTVDLSNAIVVTYGN